jgi:hypothetical protein
VSALCANDEPREVARRRAFAGAKRTGWTLLRGIFREDPKKFPVLAECQAVRRKRDGHQAVRDVVGVDDAHTGSFSTCSMNGFQQSGLLMNPWTNTAVVPGIRLV